jgi:hypothetical protein
MSGRKESGEGVRRWQSMAVDCSRGRRKGGGSTAWKTGFHCVEKWPKLASIVWKIPRNMFPLCGKTPETRFHCVENRESKSERSESWLTAGT